MEVSLEPALQPVTAFDKAPTGDEKGDNGGDENHV
jgi:hypothetical protein